MSRVNMARSSAGGKMAPLGRAKEACRVLVTTPDLGMPGGVSEYFRSLRPHLPASILYQTIGRRAAAEPPLHAAFRLLADYVRFGWRLWRERSHVVHLNPSFTKFALVRDGVFLLLAKAFGAKVLVFIHGWNPDCEALVRRALGPLFRAVYWRADSIVVLSTQFERNLRDMGYGKPVYLETTAVCDDIFTADPFAERARGPFTVLFLARVEARKGVYIALDAHAKVGERRPLARLIIAGDGSALRAAKEYADTRRIRNVIFAGFLQGEKKRQAFLSADCYVLPTFDGEGMPVSVLEAMAYGLPVVTRPVAGLKDFFETPNMGYLVASCDPADFATPIGLLMDAPALRASMGTYNRQYAAEHFAASIVARRLQGIFSCLSC